MAKSISIVYFLTARGSNVFRCVCLSTEVGGKEISTLEGEPPTETPLDTAASYWNEFLIIS